LLLSLQQQLFQVVSPDRFFCDKQSAPTISKVANDVLALSLGACWPLLEDQA